MQEAQISAAEWEVMRVVWALKQTTSTEISSVLSKKMNWKPATIKTLIGRLVKKGLLSTKQEGRKYIYSATITEEASVEEASEALFSQICTKKVGRTLKTVIEDATLSVEDIEQLEILLAKKKQTAPTSVPCNCVPGQCDCHVEEGGHHS